MHNEHYAASLANYGSEVNDRVDRAFSREQRTSAWGERMALALFSGQLLSLPQGQQRLEGSYPDRETAQPLVERLVRRRLTRRYALIDWA